MQIALVGDYSEKVDAHVADLFIHVASNLSAFNYFSCPSFVQRTIQAKPAHF